MTKETKKIGLGLIFSWIFGVLFGISGLSMLFTGIIVGGGVLILASLVILPPVCKFTKEKWNFELSRGLKVTAVIILFIIYSVSLFGSGDFDSNVNVQSSTQGTQTTATQTETAELQSYEFGDKVTVGGFVYTFNSYHTSNQIGEDLMGTFFGEKADGIFLIFDVTIENIGKESKTLWEVIL